MTHPTDLSIIIEDLLVQAHELHHNHGSDRDVDELLDLADSLRRDPHNVLVEEH